MINKIINIDFIFVIIFFIYSCSKPKDNSGMVWIEGGEFEMGGDGKESLSDEFPKHKVKLDGFWIEETEVTNSQFLKFVNDTDYITLAEIEPNWEEIKQQLPPGTPKPHDSVFVASSLVFKPTKKEISFSNISNWWEWKKGANWKKPFGKGSTINGIMNHPVVHVSYLDAVEYCKWKGRRLPKEAEWEFAARGGKFNKIFTWGNQSISSKYLNYWEGSFPYLNTEDDGYYYTSPVKSYSANGYGLYDMAGNVWEWCSDWYDYNYYKKMEFLSINPEGPLKSFDPQEPFTQKKVLRGGSFLCNSSYCSGYRVSARMKSSPDTGMSHTGFRCACD